MGTCFPYILIMLKVIQQLSLIILGPYIGNVLLEKD